MSVEEMAARTIVNTPSIKLNCYEQQALSCSGLNAHKIHRHPGMARVPSNSERAYPKTPEKPEMIVVTKEKAAMR